MRATFAVLIWIIVLATLWHFFGWWVLIIAWMVMFAV